MRKNFGSVCDYYEKRKVPRRFSAKDAGRVAAAARMAGEECGDIRAEIEKALFEAGCLPEDCDCARIRDTVIAVAGALMIAATIMASRGRANRLAAEEAAALLERLRKSAAAVPPGAIEILQDVRGVLLLNAETDEEFARTFPNRVDELRSLAQTQQTADTGVVQIKP